MKTRIKIWLARYFNWLASRVVNRFHPQIIAITGSIAKTSTREAIYYLLSRAPQTKNQTISQSWGNMNTEISLPLSLLGQRLNEPKVWHYPWLKIAALISALLYLTRIKRFPQIVIMEMAADKPGDIAFLRRYYQPNIAVITAVGPAHLEQFKTLEAIYREKAALADNLSPDAALILNQEFSQILEHIKRPPAKINYFSADLDQIASAAASAVGDFLGIKADESQRILEKFTLPHWRFELVKGKNNSLILADCYNANPLSVRAALEKIRAIVQKQEFSRVIVVLGDMLELGPRSSEYHREAGVWANKAADIFIAIGKEAIHYRADEYFSNIGQAAEFLIARIKKGDIILVKASHGMRLEKLVENLAK